MFSGRYLLAQAPYTLDPQALRNPKFCRQQASKSKCPGLSAFAAFGPLERDGKVPDRGTFDRTCLDLASHVFGG